MLRERNIVITGANRGIGKKILTSCVENGANVWAVVRTRTEEFEEYCKELKCKNAVEIWIVEIELSDENSVIKGAKEILSYKKNVWGIVNNAGITGPNKLFAMTKMEEIKEVFQVNFFSALLLTQYLLKNMVRNVGGSIVNIASVAALDGEPAQLEYVASKAALIGATKKLASEYAKFDIRVNAVAPGITDTEMLSQMKVDLKELVLDRVAMKRPAKKSEIANMVVFLLSDNSEYITGQVIRIDGGMV